MKNRVHESRYAAGCGLRRLVLLAAAALVLAVSCSSVGSTGGKYGGRAPGVSPGPCDPEASENTRALLAWLYGLETRETDRFVSGQEIGPADAVHGYDFWVEGLYERTGSRPAIIALEYFGGTNDPYPVDVERKNRVLVDHWKRGGLVSVYHNFANPWTGKRVQDRTIPEGASYSDVYTPGTRANRRFLEDLDFTADQFLHLQEEGVVVLFRPFHEMNRDAFWWHSPDPEEFKELWRYTYRHLTEVRGVHNLLYFFSPGAVNELDLKTVPPHIYYPGDGYTDIVGLDLYEENLTDAPRANYTRTVALGKLFGFGEIGGSLPVTPENKNWNVTQLAEAVKKAYPEAVFWMSWSSWYPDGIMSLVELPGAEELFADPLVADLADVDFDPPFMPAGSEAAAAAAASGALRIGSVIFHSGHLAGFPGPWESGLESLEKGYPGEYSVRHVRLMTPLHLSHALDRLILEEGCSIVLVDDPRGAGDMLIEYARRYPGADFIVSDTSLKNAPKNVHPFGTNLEGWYYLTGIIAGSVTRVGKVGYVAPSDNPWDIEHANEFALGVRTVNKTARILHTADEDTAAAVRTLAEAGCDVLNDVVRDEDVLLELEKLRDEGMPPAAFSTLVPHEAVPESVAAGSPLDMGFVFRSMIEDVLAARDGGRTPDRPAWFSVRNGSLRIGGGDPALAPRAEEELRAQTVQAPGRGRMSAYDFLRMRHRGLSEGSFVLPERSTERLSAEITVYRQ